jgi:tRNA 2-thiouridine synthesizing protein B
MLNIVKKSPYETSSLSSCLKYIKKGDVILFTEDGIYAVKKGGMFEKHVSDASQTCSIYYLSPDTEARGIKSDEIISLAKPVDYQGFVDLAIDSSKSITW